MRAREPVSFLWENVMAFAIQLWVLVRMLKWLKQVTGILEVLSFAIRTSIKITAAKVSGDK